MPLLIEAVECVKPPKGPPSAPTVKTWSVVELKRAVSSIVGRRNRLEKAIAKLKKTQTKDSKKSTPKSQQDLACAVLGVKAAKNWLEFTTSRYNLLKAKVEEHATGETKKKLDAVLAWGEPIAAAGAAHNAATDDDGTQGTIPAIPAIKYDFKTNKLVDGSGNEIVIGAEPAPEPEVDLTNLGGPSPEEFFTQPPVSPVVAIAQQAAAKQQAKKDFLKQVKDGHTSIGHPGHFHGKDVENLTIDQAVQLGQKALELIKADPAKTVTNIKGVRAYSVDVLGGGDYLSLTAAKAIVNKAKEEWDKLPKPFDKLLPSAQQLAKVTAKKAVINGGWAGDGYVSIVADLQSALATEGLHLTPQSVGALTDSAMAKYINQSFDSLPSGAQSMTLSVAEKAVSLGQSIPKALAAANLPHLTPAGLASVVEKTKAKPDESGFVQEIAKHLNNLDADYPIPTDFGGIVIAIDEESGTKFVAIMSTFHIEKAKDTHLASVIVAEAESVIAKRWNQPALEKLAFDMFDAKVKEGHSPNAAVFGHYFLTDVMDTDEAIKVGGYTASIKVNQNGIGNHAFAVQVFNKWFAGHQKKDQAKKSVEKELADFAETIIAMDDWDPNHVTHEQEQLAQDFAESYGISLEQVLTSFLTAHGAKNALTPPPPPPAPSATSLAYTPNTTELSFTYEPKLSGWHDLTSGQKSWLNGQIKQAIVEGKIPLTAEGLADLSSKSFKAWRAGKRKDMKALWGTAGVTSVGYKLFDNRASWIAEHQNPLPKPAPAPVAAPAAATPIDPDSLTYDSPEAKKKLMAAYTELVGDHASEMDGWQQVNVPQIAAKLAGGKGSDKQWNMIKKAVSMMAPAAMAAPPVMPAAAVPPAQPATMPETVAETLPSTNPLGMTPAQIQTHLSNHGKPALAPGLPTLGGSAWVGKEAIFGHGGGGVHSKSLAPCGADGKADKQGNHLWMVKTAGTPSTRYLAYAENFAIRLQSLCGLGNTKESWVEDKGLGGEKSLVQLFPDQPNLETGEKGNGLAAKKPWIVSPAVPNAGELAKQFARYHILHYVIDDKDDHAGNFVQDKTTGELTSVDHGQCFKFFDPKRTLITDFDYQPQSAGSSGSLPRKMLKHWAQGKDVALEGVLEDPALLDLLDRLESIPSDVYMESLRPYADEQHEKVGKIGKTKSLSKFLDSANARRTKIRSEVGGFYAHMAEQRANALKAKGDPRPIDQITQSVRDSIGLDVFLGGGKPKPAPQVKPITLPDGPPSWEDKNLPESSRLPSKAALAKAGTAGRDVIMTSEHVKHGMATFFQLGENPFMWCRLEPGARAILSSRLPGASGGIEPPPAPASFSFDSFTPPPAPSFSSSGEELNDEFINAGGVGSWVDPATGNPAPRVAKYISKWAKGVSKGDPGLQYVRKAWDWAKKKSVSADPVEKAIGSHYVDMLSKMGSPDGDLWSFKAYDTVPEEDRKITTFAVTKDLLTLRDVVKANATAEHKKATDAAKVVWQKDHDAAKKKWDKKEAAYKKAYADYEKKLAGSNVIPAKKLTDWPAPSGVTYNSVDPGNSVVAGKGPQPDGKGIALDAGSSWAGGFINQTSKPATSGQPAKKTAYEIDMTDAVSHIKTKGSGVTGRLLIHFQPAPATKTDRQPGRDGAFRIQFPAGSSAEEMKQMMQAVNAHLGLDVRPASHKEQELNYLRQIAWHRHMEGYGVTGGRAQKQETMALGADSTTQEKIDYWAKRFEESPKASTLSGKTGNGVGYDPRYKPKLTASGKPSKKNGETIYEKNPDGTRKANPDYQPVAVDVGAGVRQFKRFDTSAKEIGEQTAKSLAASIQSGTIESVLLAMNLSATNHRANIGFNGLGWSSAADTKTGGSNTTYLRTTTAGTDHSIEFSPLLHAYTGTWSHPSDEYGATQSYIGGNSHSQRSATVKEMQEALTRGVGSGETLGWPRLDIMRWVKKVKLSKAGMSKVAGKKLRDKIRKAIAKQQGVPESEARMGIDNKLVDEVILL